MRRHPIHDYPNATFVQVINQVSEVIRRAVTRRWGIGVTALITSRPRICNGTGKQWKKYWEGFRCTGRKDRLLRTAVTPLRVSQICKVLRRQYPERTVPTLQNCPTYAFGGYAHPSD